MAGRLEFTFAGSTVTMDANAGNVDSDGCTGVMAQLKSVASVRCQRESFQNATRTGSYLITLLTFPLQPYFNNLVSHQGNPPLSLFYCNTTMVDDEEATAPRCFVDDMLVPGDLPQVPLFLLSLACETPCRCKPSFCLFSIWNAVVTATATRRKAGATARAASTGRPATTHGTTTTSSCTPTTDPSSPPRCSRCATLRYVGHSCGCCPHTPRRCLRPHTSTPHSAA